MKWFQSYGTSTKTIYQEKKDFSSYSKTGFDCAVAILSAK